MSDRILLISSDPHLVAQVREGLSGEAYELTGVATDLEALRWLYVQRPDLIMLDVRSSPATAVRFDPLLHLREVTDLPILLFVPAEEVPRGLDHGADDCLTPPFSAAELAARVRALLRRARFPPLREWTTRYEDEQVCIDLSRQEVRVRGQWVHLTPTEFRLLACLVGQAGDLVSYEELLARVWGPGQTGRKSQLVRCIHKLRRKIEPDPRHPTYIITVRGVGYRFVTR